MRCAVIHGQVFSRPHVFRESVRIAAVVPQVDDDGCQHPVHADIIKLDICYDTVFSSAPAALDAKAAVCGVEEALRYAHIADTAGQLASQSQRSVAEIHQTVADRVVVSRSLVFAGHLYFV